MDELIGAITAFEYVIYVEKKVSAAYGSLLSHLFAQLEASWRGEVFNVDIKTVQLCLLKRILKDNSVGLGFSENLVIWTAALKDIRMLSVAARELTLKWVLRRCRSAESDWPVIFHNLLLMCSDNRTMVFEGLYGCLDERPSAPLMDHLIFLIGQDGSLGKSWIKWTMARGCFKISPIAFSGLLTLSEDGEYFHVLGPALLNNVKLMQGIWTDLCRAKCSSTVIDPVEYLKQVSKWIGSESEAGIKGASRLIENMWNCSDLKGLSESFFLDLYKLYPFARRELLKSSSKYKRSVFWKELYHIDDITLKEHLVDDHVLDSIIKAAPELLKNLIDHEDQIHLISSISDDDRIRALIAIESIVLQKALKYVGAPFDCNSNFSVITEIGDWREVSIGEILVLNFDQIIPKLMELCELLQVPGALDGCKGGIENLTDLAVEFISSEAGEGVYSVRERISLISKLVSNLPESVICTLRKDAASFTGLLRMPYDWNSYEGTLKYLLERISVYSPEFNSLLPKIPVKTDFQVLISHAICKMSEPADSVVPLTSELLSVIGGMAGRVVSEPQLVKPLMSLLSVKSYQVIEGVRLNVQSFSEISEPNLIRSVVEFAMKYEGIVEGIVDELIKSIIMFYGIIEDYSEGSISNQKIKIPGNSKLKHLHVNEKSVNFAVLALLTRVQGKLNSAHKLMKNCPEIYSANPDEFIEKWIVIDELIGMTKGLISGKAASKLHTILSSFYDLITRLLQNDQILSSALKELAGIVGSRLNRQVYSLIPLQQEKMQNNLKQELNLKKPTEKTSKNISGSTGKSVTGLVFSMEKFEETLIKAVESDGGGTAGWCEKIVRSTARDFKIRLEPLL